MKKIVKFLICVSSIIFYCCVATCDLFAQEFTLTYHEGLRANYQPTLSQRLSGIKKIYVFYPKQSDEDTRYICHNFNVYLQRLGLQVIERGVAYERTNISQYGAAGYYLTCKEDVTKYLDDANSLMVVINTANVYTMYGDTILKATYTFADIFNNMRWEITLNIADSAEKYIKQCQREMCSSWTYNSTHAYHPGYISSNYSIDVLRSYLSEGDYTSYEGIYEGDEYTLGVKKGIDEKYYIIYHGCKSNAPGWDDGYIKAELRETATSGVYRATWYERNFAAKSDYKIIFEEGIFTLYNEKNEPELYLKMFPTNKNESNNDVESRGWSGTAFALKDGYVVTNYHVIEDATNITVQGVKGDFSNKLTAQVVAADKFNDLAILKINDSRFSGFGTIPYLVKTNISDVAEDVFVLGYPMTSTMGDEIKYTTGVISSKTGFQGDVSQYQISAPIQPGNSGGPLFDAKGNVIGIVSAKHADAENVGYAIKSSYLKNLIESVLPNNILPSTNSIQTLSNAEKVKKIKSFVFLINANTQTVKSTNSSTSTSVAPENSTQVPSGSTNQTYTSKVETNKPQVSNSLVNQKGERIVLSKEATVKVGDIISAELDGKTVESWEINSATASYVTTLRGNKLKAIKEGSAQVWGYIDNAPKLFKFNIVNTDTILPGDKPIKVITSKECTIEVGDHIIARLAEGDVSRWEINQSQSEYVDIGQHILVGKKSGNISIWGYIDNNPKLFKITIK